MTRILMTIMAVAMAVTFSAPSFAGEAMKGSHVLVYDEEQNEKKGVTPTHFPKRSRKTRRKKKTPSSPFSLARPVQEETH